MKVRIFISMPMSGKTQAEIEKSRKEEIKIAIEKATNDFNCSEEDIEIIDSFVKEDYSHPLMYLGESIKRLAEADGVYMSHGWSKAHGCVIECECAKRYGKHIFGWLD